VTGQLVRVDPRTGDACIVLDTGVPATSVRFAEDFPPYQADSDAFVSSELGEIIHVHLTGLKIAAPAPPVAAPAVMHLTLAPRTVRRGRPRSVRVTVSSSSSACRAGVRVRIGRRTALTGARGSARLRVKPAAGAGALTVTARKAGCRTASARLRVLAS
jgi:hypothetical protein